MDFRAPLLQGATLTETDPQAGNSASNIAEAHSASNTAEAYSALPDLIFFHTGTHSSSREAMHFRAPMLQGATFAGYRPGSRHPLQTLREQKSEFSGFNMCSLSLYSNSPDAMDFCAPLLQGATFAAMYPATHFLFKYFRNTL